MDCTAMDLSRRKELLNVLLANSKRILDAKFGVNAAESTFFQVVELLRDDEALKQDFLQQSAKTFLQADGWGLEPNAVPRELIELVAHELRWPELREQADTRLLNRFRNDSALARGDIAISIRDALSDDWSDREFYQRYR